MRCFSRIRRKLSISPVLTKSEAPSTNDASGSMRAKDWGLSRAIQVQPKNAVASTPTKSSTFIKKFKLYELAVALYYWTTCLFIIALVCSQLLGAVWDARTTITHIVYGENPLLGPYQIVGSNDVPYTDRVIACVRKGTFYEPRVVSSLLAAPGISAILEDSTGTAVHGYRLKQRHTSSVSDSLDSTAQELYESSCALISQTMDNILDGCSKLGYNNLTTDNIRVVDDWDSKTMFQLPNTLPVLIMPYWDNSPYARHVIPTWAGDACIFRLEDAYNCIDTPLVPASFRGVNQTVHHERTIEWLGRPGGAWKNGWYEDLEGMKWYSDVKSSNVGAPYYMMHRLFDMRTGNEVDCSNPSDCESTTHTEWWGDKFSLGGRDSKINSVSIANASEWGLFIYESHQLHIVKSIFDWETLLSNVSVGLILFRWVLVLVSLHIGAFRGKSQWFGGGIGCISGARSFAYLPMVSLPRLKMTLAAFWTVGCAYEGQQIGLSEAWFAMYPAIVQFVLIYYSLLNTLAKVLRRRVTDVLFTPTIIIFCLMHYFRKEISVSGWLNDIDGRVATVIFSDEVKQLQLADYFTTDTAWRMNGRVPLLFGVKLGVLSINLLPLLLTQSFPFPTRHADSDMHGVEKALASRATCIGGLGRSLSYIVAVIDTKSRSLSSSKLVMKIVSPSRDQSDHENYKGNKTKPDDHATPVHDYPNIQDVKDATNHVDAHEVTLVNSYELTRLGYLVFGDKYLITFDEWDLLSPMAPLRSFWNHRVVVWTLLPANADNDAELAGGRALACTEPQLWRLNDPRLQPIRWWQISACSIQC